MSKYNYPHPTPWNGKKLEGAWRVSIKIDGVRMLRDSDGNPISRNGKPLFNLDKVPKEITDAEIYYGDWETSVSHVRSSVTDVGSVDSEHVFSLWPVLDERLDLGIHIDLEPEQVQVILEEVLKVGYEGLVVRELSGKERIFKVKPHETFDVPVTGMVMGTGKHKGRMGALITPRGKVGTGFTDKDRELWLKVFNREPCGVILDEDGNVKEYRLVATSSKIIIEVECWELTKDGKFRHPRYVRLREDK